MRYYRGLKIRLFLLLCFLGMPALASACRGEPGPAQTERALRQVIEKADYLFIGRVSYVSRRRWSEDDVRPRTHPRLKEHAKRRGAGEEIGYAEYFVYHSEFVEATAHLEIVEELYWPGLLALGQTGLIPIDLLRPISFAGYGPCYNFPETCPWELEIGQLVAVAIKENPLGASSVSVCSKIPPLTSGESEKIRQVRNATTKYDAMLPFLSQFQYLRVEGDSRFR